MRRGLSLAGPQRCFQFLAQPLDLLPQAVAFLLQALTFPLPSLVLLLEPFDLPLGSVELWLGDQLDDFALLPIVRRTAATGCFHLLYGSGTVGFVQRNLRRAECTSPS